MWCHTSALYVEHHHAEAAALAGQMEFCGGWWTLTQPQLAPGMALKRLQVICRAGGMCHAWAVPTSEAGTGGKPRWIFVSVGSVMLPACPWHLAAYKDVLPLMSPPWGQSGQVTFLVHGNNVVSGKHSGLPSWRDTGLPMQPAGQRCPWARGYAHPTPDFLWSGLSKVKPHELQHGNPGMTLKTHSSRCVEL